MATLPLSYPAPYKCSNWNIPHRSWMPVSHIWYHHISAVQIQRTREKHIGPFKDQKAPSPSYHRVILNSTRRSKNSMSIAPEANTRKGERTTLHFWGRGDQEPQSISYWNKVSEIITFIIKKRIRKPHAHCTIGKQKERGEDFIARYGGGRETNKRNVETCHTRQNKRKGTNKLMYVWKNAN